MPALKNVVPINRAILKWARLEANFSIEKAAEKAGIKELRPRGVKAAMAPWQRLESWETGEGAPTFNQLKNIAKVYRRPLLTFFLERPPLKETRISDFRTLGDKTVKDKDTPEFTALLRQTEALHRRISDLLEQIESKKVDIIGSINNKINPKLVVQAIRDKLAFPFESHINSRNKRTLFSEIRNKAENIGIFVFKIGNLGSYHTNIDPEVFRGLAISDPYAPLVIINPNDSPSAQLFTIIHELTHLWLGDTGISNLNAFRLNLAGSIENEIFCNKVAAEFLVPEEKLQIDYVNIRGKVLVTAVSDLAMKYKVSEVVIARRLLDFKYIERSLYWSIYKNAMYQWKLEKERQKKLSKESDGGIPLEVRTKSKFGKKFINIIIEAARSGQLTELDASHILKVRINRFEDIYSATA